MPLQPMITAARHMISSGHYLATEAGHAVLEAGGNAVDAGVAAGIYYPIPLHRQECFVGVASGTDLPETDRAAAEVLSLPMYPELQADQRAWVAESILAFYER